MIYRDTIAAISTGMSASGIGIVRISGGKAFDVINRIYHGKDQLSEAESHTIHYGFIKDEGEMIDQVLVSVMRSPRTFTGEDTVEINCHGGIFVVKKVLEIVLKSGARLAEPGEFTKRAFLNGRIDLSQAEAVMDLIESKSRYAMESSMSQLKGSVKERIVTLRNHILDDVAFIEAALDDPEHISMDEFEDQFCENLNNCISELQQIKENYKNGRMIKEGIRTVIIGRPNVGKSSFLNRILGVERAIVTNVPGTTRDTLEEDVRLGDLFLHVIDTAGIHETEDVVEKIGIEKALECMGTADFCILLINGSEDLMEDDIELMRKISDLPGVILLNKNDLAVKIDTNSISQYTDKKVISFSAKTGDGLIELENYVKEQFYLEQLSFNDEVYISNERQKQAVEDSYASLMNVKESLELNLGEDFYTIDLMNAYEQLGRIIGESVDDDLVDTIFKKFCMGK